MKRIWLLPVVVAGVSAAVAATLPFARAQVQLTPSYVSLGVAASGNTSTAWFHHPSAGTVVACQAVAGTGGSISSIQCVTSKLP